MKSPRILSALFGLVLVSGGCGDAVAPAGLAAPDAPRLATDGTPIRLLRAFTPLGGEDSTVVAIDSAGGELKLGPHMLTVPAGAVTAPTVFTMRLVRQDEGASYVEVDLSAHRLGANGSPVAVGTPAAPFLKPLNLKLNYSMLVETPAAERLVVAYLVDHRASGALEKQPTVVAQNSKWVIAKLTHFSRYAVGEM